MNFEVQLYRYADVLDDWVEPQDVERASRLRDDLAERFLKRRSALRRLVNSREPILIEPNGRPYFQTGPGFSISSSGEYFAIAIGPSVGVDIERVRPFDFRPLLTDHFTTAEQTQIVDERTFFRAWTIKEAVAKSTGDGIGESLSRFEVCDQGVAGFAVEASEPAPGVLAAVAAMLTSGHEDPNAR